MNLHNLNDFLEKIEVIRNYYWPVELKKIRGHYQCIKNKRTTKSSIDFRLAETNKKRTNGWKSKLEKFNHYKDTVRLIARRNNFPV